MRRKQPSTSKYPLFGKKAGVQCVNGRISSGTIKLLTGVAVKISDAAAFCTHKDFFKSTASYFKFSVACTIVGCSSVSPSTVLPP